MIQKYTYGTPFETDAIVTSIPASEGTPAYGTISTGASAAPSWSERSDR